MSNEPTEITYRRDESISLPSTEQERRIAIRYRDWERCKKKLNKIKQPIPRFHLVFSFLFGISASSGFSLVTLYTQPEAKLPAWEFPLYWLLLVFSLGVAICFVYLDRQMRESKESDIDEIIEDMESIEQTFPGA
jgi:hypothetical protein